MIKLDFATCQQKKSSNSNDNNNNNAGFFTLNSFYLNSHFLNFAQLLMVRGQLKFAVKS